MACFSALSLPPHTALRVALLLKATKTVTAEAVSAIPARTLSEYNDWFTNNEHSKAFKRPNEESLLSALRVLTLVACRLRFDTGGTGVVSNHNPRSYSLRPVLACSRRFLRKNVSRKIIQKPGEAAVPVAPKRALARVGRARPTFSWQGRVAPIRRPSVFKRTAKRIVSRNGDQSASGSATTAKTSPVKTLTAQKRPQYIRRELYFSQKSKTMAPHVEGENADCKTLRTIFPPPLRKLKCPWETALLFRDAPGFFRYAEVCKVEPDALEACFRTAVGKRCVTLKSQVKAAGFVSAFVFYAVAKSPPQSFFGAECLFVMVEFLTKLKERGPSAPGMAKWAFKVYEEILGLVFPLQHPAIVAVSGREKSGIPPLAKRAPMLEMGLILDLERIATYNGSPVGMRFYASAYLLMVFASLRFSDCKAIIELWTTETAVCGRSIDLKLKTRPIITWATPIGGIRAEGKWAEPLFKVWKRHPPMEGGRHSLFRFSDDTWSIDVTRRPHYYTVLKMFRKLCEYMGYEKPIWTLHSARAWFPTCAAQLGWSEDDRRRLGHWAPGSAMMETYDRADCTSELRLRNTIMGKIAIEGWSPTKAFEVPPTDSIENNPPVQEPASGRETQVGTSATPKEDAVNKVSTDCELSGDDSSTSSLTWDKVSVLSEVDIADLYGDLSEPSILSIRRWILLADWHWGSKILARMGNI